VRASFTKNLIQVTDEEGEVHEASPLDLIHRPAARIWAFKMMKEKKGNWDEVKKWFEEVLGWQIQFLTQEPLDPLVEAHWIVKWKRGGSGKDRAVPSST